MEHAPVDTPFRILYEDNHLLVVEKPANIPVQADVSGDDDLLSMCKRYIKEAYHKPGDVYLGLVHRLDRPVGGVMVFARTSKAAARLTAQFAGHKAKKRYCAVVRGCTPAGERLTDYLYKDETTFSSRVVPEGTSGAKRAELAYATLACHDGFSLVDVQLFTGRPHQIRVQLSHAGYPIVGDQRYGAAMPGKQIRLWAYALTLTHPTLNEEMTFFSAPFTAPGEQDSPDAFAAFPAETALLPAFTACRGVHLDDDMVIVDKEAGTEVVEDLVPAVSSIVGPVYPVHRLDANTEGLVILARTEQARARLEEAFRAHTGITKTYEAILCGTPSPREGTLTDTLLKDAETSTVRIVPDGTRGGRTARLSYRVREVSGRHSLVDITLETGRTHQIRVQMAGIGCPVLGDDKYGNREENKLTRSHAQRLLAKSLTLDGTTYVSRRELTLLGL